MGRLSLVETDQQRRSTRGNEPVYARRPPQIGSSFQLRRLPDVDDSYISSRKMPLPVSKDHPHRTVQEVESRNGASAQILANTIPPSAGEGIPASGYETQRGGLLVHRRVDETACFPSFASHFNVISPLSTSLWEWSLELRQWEEHHQDATRRSRGSKKRKHESLPANMMTTTATTSPFKRQLNLPESQNDNAWHYLWQHHGGNVPQASLACMVEYSAGKAYASLLRGEGYSWREFVQRRHCTITGDCTDSDSHTHVSMESDWDAETLQGTWGAVLHCAKLCQDHQHQQPVTLSALSRFLVMASRLPEAMDVALSREVNTTLSGVVKQFLAARQERAKLFDLWGQPSVDVDSLRKHMEKVNESSIILDEMEEMKRQVRQVSSWQQRLEQVYSECATDDNRHDCDDLSSLENLHREGKLHGFRAKSFVMLEQRIMKALAMRDRIVEFQRTTRNQTFKTVSSIVRDVHRLKIRFPAVNQLLSFHHTIEAWVDRANIATRSRLSLREVLSLIDQGAALSLDVTDHIAKLQMRVESANDWISRFHDIIGYDGEDRWTIIQKIRALLDEDHGILQELATEGSRMPVEVDEIRMLQIELDASDWSVKANKWFGNSARLVELREHMGKASTLRERLMVEDKARWTLQGEDALVALVGSADAWLEETEPILSKSTSVSVKQLRELHRRGKELDVSIGQPMSKLTKAFNQADGWFCQNEATWLKSQNKEEINHEELAKAAAQSGDMTTILEEATQLNDLLVVVNKWRDSCTLVIGEEDGKPLSLEQVAALLEEAKSIPMNTQSICARLEEERSRVMAWQQQATVRTESLLCQLISMQNTMKTKYGEPDDLTWTIIDANRRPQQSSAADTETVDRISCAKDLCPSLGAQAIEAALDKLCDEAESFSIKTPHSRAFDDSSQMLRWTFYSIKIMHNKRYIFDKRFFGAFDRLVKEPKSFDCGQYDDKFLCRLTRECAKLVKDQAHRLHALRTLRQNYVKDCKQAQQILSDPKPCIEKISAVAKLSRSYPVMDDALKSLNSRLEEAKAWVEECKRTLEVSGRVTIGEANSLLSQCASIGFSCSEAETLRTGVTSAKNWARRVRKYCKEENLDPLKIKSLSKEYDSLIIEMTDDYQKLGRACTKYCICRKVYSGFMICCDECEDWFHGPCVGLTEISVKKKYVCVRCGIRKTYNASTSSIASIVRKWSSPKELQRVRELEEKKLTNKELKIAKALEELLAEKSKMDSELQQECAGPSPPNLENLPLFPLQGCQLPDAAVACSLTTIDSTGSNPAPSPPGKVVEKNEPSSAVKLVESKTEPSGRHQTIVNDLKKCSSKMDKVKAEREALRRRYRTEDASFVELKNWSLKIRSLILAPPSEEVALASRPHVDGSLSRVMVSLRNEAETKCLHQFSDVGTVMNHIRCLAWCMRAAGVFTRQPTDKQLKELVNQGVDLVAASQLATTMRTLKGFLARLTTWESAVFEELKPKPLCKQKFNEAHLANLSRQAEQIPFRTSLEDRIATVLEDNASRHCLCGGPSDGRFMIGCDGCDEWYHGHCVGIPKDTPEDELANWICPRCSKATVELDLENFHRLYDVADEGPLASDDVAPKAVKPDQLWPPLGLLYSARAIKALGVDCCAVPDTSHNVAGTPILALQLETDGKVCHSPSYLLIDASGVQVEKAHSAAKFDCKPEPIRAARSTPSLVESDSATLKQPPPQTTSIDTNPLPVISQSDDTMDCDRDGPISAPASSGGSLGCN